MALTITFHQLKAEAIKAKHTKRGPGRPRREAWSKKNAFLPGKIVVPDPPTETEPSLRDEQQIVRTEILMLKGVREKRALRTLLGVDSDKTMQRYMDRVYVRWESYGSLAKIRQLRGEALAKYDMIEQELWDTTLNSDPRVRIVALKTLLDLQIHRAEILGITPKIVAQLSFTDESGLTFRERMEQHGLVARISARISELAQQKAIEEAKAFEVPEEKVINPLHESSQSAAPKA